MPLYALDVCSKFLFRGSFLFLSGRELVDAPAGGTRVWAEPLLGERTLGCGALNNSNEPDSAEK